MIILTSADLGAEKINGAGSDHYSWILRDLAFAVGFLSAIESLAEYGAAGWGGTDKFVDAQNEHYRCAQRMRDTEERERAFASVARMNAGRAAKKALGEGCARRNTRAALRGGCRFYRTA